MNERNFIVTLTNDRRTNLRLHCEYPPCTYKDGIIQVRCSKLLESCAVCEAAGQPLPLVIGRMIEKYKDSDYMDPKICRIYPTTERTGIPSNVELYVLWNHGDIYYIGSDLLMVIYYNEPVDESDEQE